MRHRMAALIGTSTLLAAGMQAGAEPITIEVVSVGNPGNAGDPIEFQGVFGAVDHVFAIGKYEVTAGQYAAFLNAVAAADPFLLYDTRMWTHAQGCKIERVFRDSAAGNAYLKAGEIITDIDGERIQGTKDLTSAIEKRKLGNVVTVSFLRNGARVQTKVLLK